MSFCINPQCPQPENSDNLHFCVGCSSPLLLVHRYRVAKLMSNKGGFGNTYEMSRNGVAKVLKVLKSNDDMSIELFNREFTVLKDLNEQGVRGIPGVEDLFSHSHKGSPEPLHCLVMERIDGTNLEEYINRSNHPIDEATALLWLSKLTQILKEIHTKQIFHRDIKHSNIILHPDGHQLVLIDFGAAKQAAYRVSKPGTRIFTPGYAAPEQEVRGQASAKSDFFSLGRTFVYLLTKEEPESLYDNKSNQFRWRHLTNNISDDLLNLIDRLMERDPDRRPESSDLILTELKLLSKKNEQVLPRPIGQLNPSQQITQSRNNSSTTSSGDNSSIPTTVAPINLPEKDRYSLKSIAMLLALTSVIAFAIWWLLNHNGNTSQDRHSTGTFKEVTGVPTGTFKFGGSTTWATTRRADIAIDSVIKGIFPKYNIQYVDNKSPNYKIRSIENNKCPEDPGSNAGVCWLIEGDLDFTQSSIPLEKYNGFNKKSTKSLKAEAVAYDAVTVVVNPNLNISVLSITQLRDIYTGKITNWNQVGGENLPIIPVSRDESFGGTVSYFKDLVLNGQAIQATSVRTTTEGLQQVLKNRGAIYYGAAKEVIVDSCGTKPIAIGNSLGSSIKPYLEPLRKSVDDCGNKGKRNKINTEVLENQTYPLTRKIYVITKTDGSNSQKAGEAYLNLLKTKQGQTLLEQSGFVSIDNSIEPMRKRHD